MSVSAMLQSPRNAEAMTAGNSEFSFVVINDADGGSVTVMFKRDSHVADAHAVAHAINAVVAAKRKAQSA